MSCNNFPESWKRDYPNIEFIEEDYLVQIPVMNQRYHLSWASSLAMSWKLMSVSNNSVFMITPITKRPLTTSLSSLRETKRNAVAKAKAREQRKLNY